MSIIDLLRTGMKNLWRRKMRTSLTLLSVAIGASSIVVMISLGIGMQQSFLASLQQMGSLNVITVYQGWSADGQEMGKITDSSISDFEALEGVQAVTPLQSAYGLIMTGKYAAEVSIYGIRADKAQYFDLETDQGTGLSADNPTGVVMGSYIVQQYFNPKKRNYWETMGTVSVDPLTEQSYLFLNPSVEYSKLKSKDGTRISVSGILKQYQNQQDYCVYMDIDKLNELVKEQQKKTDTTSGSGTKTSSAREYEQAWVKAEDMNQVATISAQIQEMGYSSYSLGDMLGELNKVAQTIQLVLGAIGGVSLLIAAIGIANTMVMSTYERTREIGIMKVIGAKVRDVNNLFLLEAGFLGLVGGAIGILLSHLISFLLNNTGLNIASLIGFSENGAHLSVIPFWLDLLALVFSSLIGVLAGIIPARRASTRISALEAIRNDG